MFPQKKTDSAKKYDFGHKTFYSLWLFWMEEKKRKVFTYTWRALITNPGNSESVASVCMASD